jgi:hypothetical protein
LLAMPGLSPRRSIFTPPHEIFVETVVFINRNSGRNVPMRGCSGFFSPVHYRGISVQIFLLRGQFFFEVRK